MSRSLREQIGKYMFFRFDAEGKHNISFQNICSLTQAGTTVGGRGPPTVVSGSVRVNILEWCLVVPLRINAKYKYFAIWWCFYWGEACLLAARPRWLASLFTFYHSAHTARTTHHQDHATKKKKREHVRKYVYTYILYQQILEAHTNKCIWVTQWSIYLQTSSSLARPKNWQELRDVLQCQDLCVSK